MNALPNAVLSVEMKDLPLLKKGKVREVYDLGERLLIVATDRISAFDVIMPDGIPAKGKVLTAMSLFWFARTGGIVPNHLITADLQEAQRVSGVTLPRHDVLAGRFMLVKKATPFPVECVVRGYLAGSGWKEYRTAGTLAGIPLPAGLRESDRLPEPLFTPSTKEETGHDRNLTQEEAAAMLGQETYRLLAEASLAVYRAAAAYAEGRGIIIADTKFEFGRVGDGIILIDEVLTPDSSRFWPRDDYRPGGPQPSFDKQYLRDWLESIGWDKSPPAPRLPADVVQNTAEKYLEAHRRLTGGSLTP